MNWWVQIVGKSKIKIDDGGLSDSDESMNASNISKQAIRSKVQSFTPSTPPQTAAAAAAKRRKGVPRRAPTGGLLLGY